MKFIGVTYNTTHREIDAYGNIRAKYKANPPALQVPASHCTAPNAVTGSLEASDIADSADSGPGHDGIHMPLPRVEIDKFGLPPYARPRGRINAHAYVHGRVSPAPGFPTDPPEPC